LAQKSSTKLLIAIGLDSQDLECLDLYNINEGWKVLTRLPMRYGLSGASVVTFGNNIFISGGVGAGGILKAVR